MFPNRDTAIKELEIASEKNSGSWTEHSYNAAKAAERIAERCKMDSEKAFVLGLLHDIGRRTGIAAVRHIIDGYDYAIHWRTRTVFVFWKNDLSIQQDATAFFRSRLTGGIILLRIRNILINWQGNRSIGFCRILKIVYMYKVGAESVSVFYI